MLKKCLRLGACLLPALLVVGCATQQAPYDYTAFKQAKPRSIVVLPPLNNSPDLKATYSMLSQVTHPLAEAGYYVLPVAVVDETFKQNGLTSGADIHAVAPAKIQEIFGADAALYITVSKYGTSYQVIDSVTAVTADARLVDLKTGTVLWTGAASASSNEGGNNGGNLLGALITAAVKQIINTTTDASHPLAGVASARLLSGGLNNGLLYGPRSVNYSKN
ncbi:DUF799 domain-containing protein [Janthinobacterium fluminis]|uniref:DUF799 domain-containing protein n=1 Tax=Janthinobacterium fluminis TaxID=2987524 RepID=A0ABT5JZX3_9BURK|nr:DUF799 domain-containing protein [Janthinobacterium fluminis]MDC8757750.1 DUF799 domain-containing protein [Janthinobacterium fluminis]